MATSGRRRAQTIFLIITSVSILIWPGTASAVNRILNIRHWVSPDHTRIVIDTSQDAQFKVAKEDRKLTLQFEHTDLARQLPRALDISKPGIDKIAVRDIPLRTAVIELELPAPLVTNVFKLPKFQEKTYRVVIDIELPQVEKKEEEATPPGKKGPIRKRVVIIDPGHGGEDPGALGCEMGTNEKDVVLEIGRKLRDELNNCEGMHAYLTRDGDYYVPFNKRLKLARDRKADLFVSI
ncbi:MAG: N-acetylmuramoyl-L-alanine amidase, partial [Smithellaceae bacterium]|nr:N-acetylmuramoyl-L-alanine amidase [Smithellaceae bacterium]